MSSTRGFYLIDYLKNNYPIDEEQLDSLKFSLDYCLYFYGHQFQSSREECGHYSRLKLLKEALKDILRYCRGYLNSYPVNDKPKIMANTYFSYNSELSKLGFNVFLSPWIKQYVRGYPPRHIKNSVNHLNAILISGEFNEIISQGFLNKIAEIEGILKEYYLLNEFRALCVPYDLPFFENWNIKIFRKIKRPSFIFLHGLMQDYENRDTRSDYLIVWGDKIKENYIKAGINSSKIFVSGHPDYKDFAQKELKFSLDNILVLNFALISWHIPSFGVSLQDRGNTILYLYSVQNVLQKLGIKQVRIRPHPADNPAWYKKFIDNNFYKFDQMPLKASLSQSSLVIGPPSTAFLESIYYGINYVAYEPTVDGFIWGSKLRLVPPFDGSDQRVPVAQNEEELQYILKNKIKVDPSVFNDYIKSPFDLSFIKKLI